MALNMSRLTLFAVISAIEDDLRAYIRNSSSWSKPPEMVLSEDVLTKARNRQSKDVSLSRAASLEDLLPFLDFGDYLAIIMRELPEMPLDIQEIMRASHKSVEQLLPVRNRVFHGRPLEYDDFSIVIDNARQLVSQSKDLFARTQEVLLKTRNDPDWVLNISLPPLSERADTITNNLPIADFDETGFVGRSRQLSNIKKSLLSGVHPIVTIVGEGGLGKTALALKVAYEILDDPKSPFEAIVWVSAKSKQFSAGEVQRIREAVTSSVGVFSLAAKELGMPSTADPKQELRQYLECFRILLVLDNMETAMDHDFRDFLRDLPTGSKVLITSRIGLGEMEVRHVLEAMTEQEALLLFRRFVQIRNVSVLMKVDNATGARFCARLHLNPLWIKWFVHAVGAGTRPEQVFQQQKAPLQFCMENVYDKLSEGAKQLLNVWQVLPGRKAQSELAFLMGIGTLEEVIAMQRDLIQIQATNMLTMFPPGIGAEQETTYEISDMARAFLAKLRPIPARMREHLMKKQKELRALIESSEGQLQKNPYALESLTIRGPKDLVSVRKLQGVLQMCRQKEYGECEQMLEHLEAISPDYWEIFRVKAFVAAMRGDYAVAEESYERALELAPEAPQLRLFFGNFLVRCLDSHERALAQFDIGLQLDPTSPLIKIEKARIMLYNYRFEEAEEVLEDLNGFVGTTSVVGKKVCDLLLQVCTRRAESLMKNKDCSGAMENFKKVMGRWRTYHPEVRDEKMRSNLVKSAYTAHVIRKEAATEELRNLARRYIYWLHSDVAPVDDRYLY